MPSAFGDFSCLGQTGLRVRNSRTTIMIKRSQGQIFLFIVLKASWDGVNERYNLSFRAGCVSERNVFWAGLFRSDSVCKPPVFAKVQAALLWV